LKNPIKALTGRKHPAPKAPDSRQVRRQKERLAKKPSLVNPKVLGRER
jgi:hypothetical protein